MVKIGFVLIRTDRKYSKNLDALVTLESKKQGIVNGIINLYPGFNAAEFSIQSGKIEVNERDRSSKIAKYTNKTYKQGESGWLRIRDQVVLYDNGTYELRLY